MDQVNFKEKYIFGFVLITLLVSFFIIYAGATSINKSAKVYGCQQAINALLSPLTEPKCSLRDDRLVVSVTHPILRQIKTYDLKTGKELSQ